METGEARSWDIDKARLLGVIERLHATVEGLNEANRQLLDTNRQLVETNKELLRALTGPLTVEAPAIQPGRKAV